MAYNTLPTNIANGAPNHAAIHNETNGRANELSHGTGWRDIAALLVNGHVLSANGYIRVRRVGDRVDLAVRGLDASAATDNETVSALPMGFRPPQSVRDLGVSRSSYGPTSWVYNPSGVIAFMKVSSPADGLVFRSWITANDWPTELPGVPASW